MEQYALYLVIKEIAQQINNKIKYTFNDMDSNKGNVCGIYIKVAEPSEYRGISDGKYFNNIVRVQLLIQSDLSTNSYFECFECLSSVRDAIIGTYNVYRDVSPTKVGFSEGGELKYNDGTEQLKPAKVIITNANLLSDIINVGKSEQGKQRFSINIKVSYKIMLKEEEQYE